MSSIDPPGVCSRAVHVQNASKCHQDRHISSRTFEQQIFRFPKSPGFGSAVASQSFLLWKNMLKWESSAFPKDHAVTKLLCFQLGKQVTRHVIMSTRIRSALFRHYLHLDRQGINEHVQPLHVCRSWSCKHIGSAWTGLFEQVFGYPLSATRIRVKQRSRDKSCWVRFVQHEFETSRCIFNDHADVIMASICKAHCQRLPEPKDGRSMVMLCDFLVPANGLVQPLSFEGHLNQTSPRNLREHK